MNTKLKYFKSDNDTEYNQITEYCKTKDIVHQKTASYAHEQAEASERINLTLLNKIRTMLFTANLQNKFWAMTLEAAVYIYNRTPHSSLNFKTPYEIKYSKLPKLNHIKI